jgi:hypothetical protein
MRVMKQLIQTITAWLTGKKLAAVSVRIREK